jgi:hypothetical protein
VQNYYKFSEYANKIYFILLFVGKCGRNFGGIGCAKAESEVLQIFRIRNFYAENLAFAPLKTAFEGQKCRKKHFFCIFFAKYLVNSKKSSTFAPAFQKSSVLLEIN